MLCNQVPAMENVPLKSGNWLFFKLKGKINFSMSTQPHTVSCSTSSASDSLLWQIISCIL